MEWITLDAARVLADMPTNLMPLYQAWITDNPDKAGRLAEMTALMVSEIRDAIATKPENVLDEDTAKVPESCLRHAENILILQLMLEMGQTPSDEAQQIVTQASIFMRSLQYGHFRATAGNEPTPRYNFVNNTPERALP